MTEEITTRDVSDLIRSEGMLWSSHLSAGEPPMFVVRLRRDEEELATATDPNLTLALARAYRIAHGWEKGEAA